MRVFILDRKLQEQGIGIVDLSGRSGVGRSTIDDIRRNNGSGRRRATIEKLAAALGLQYDDLFEETEPDAAAPAATRITGIDHKELVDIAEQYEDEGNLAMYQCLTGLASRLGNSVEALLDRGDELLDSGDEEGAKGVYARAILALKSRHLSRLKQSLRRYLDLCEKDRDAPPIISLYRTAKERKMDDPELFYLIGTFFARTRQPDDLVKECFGNVNRLIDLED